MNESHLPGIRHRAEPGDERPVPRSFSYLASSHLFLALTLSLDVIKTVSFKLRDSDIQGRLIATQIPLTSRELDLQHGVQEKTVRGSHS